MMFKYDPGAHASDLRERGFAHLRDVLADEFVSCLTDFHAAAMAEASRESEAWKIARKKRQFVFDFPSPEVAAEFRRGMSALTGIDEADFTISERHLKVYDREAPPFPAPHKDRAASHFSIGMPVDLPEGSTVCVFPELEPGPNTKERAVFLTPVHDADPAVLYDAPGAVMLNEAVGDLVVFLGSSIFHERVRSAGTSVLYVKANGTGDDPLGEDIYSGQRAAVPA